MKLYLTILANLRSRAEEARRAAEARRLAIEVTVGARCPDVPAVLPDGTVGVGPDWVAGLREVCR